MDFTPEEIVPGTYQIEECFAFRAGLDSQSKIYIYLAPPDNQIVILDYSSP
jgi:hypothetical protein